MKKIAISTLAVLIAAPAFADAGMGHSDLQFMGMDTYIGLRGGMGYTNLNYRHAGEKNSMTDTVWQGRAAFGLELCDTVRSEIEWSLYGKAKDSDTFGIAGKTDVKTKLQTLMWNSYWEYSEYQIIRPFVGIGAGVAFSDVSATYADGTHDGDAKTRFTGMGSVGLTFDWETFAVDIAARYNYVNIESGLHNFGGDIGIRFMF
ncbi:MAG: hypothetical protein IJ560_00075 [Alphaproteobacteria bacterium]|nr:hypothetical protein [Alphaproteobacteria bacterium]